MNIAEPCMTTEEKKLIVDLMNERQPKRVLEYGLGWSTYHFSQLPYITDYFVAEHNIEWVNNIKPLVSSKVNIVHTFLNLDPRERDNVEFNKQIATYVDMNGETDFDLIFVDGMCREQCMRAATKKLKPDGICLLHDSFRDGYKPYYKFFKNHKELTQGNFVHGTKHQGLTLLWN